jgi:hypothetical protein
MCQLRLFKKGKHLSIEQIAYVFGAVQIAILTSLTSRLPFFWLRCAFGAYKTIWRPHKIW